MGNKSCYSSNRRRTSNVTSGFIGITNPSQNITRMTRDHLLHDKVSRQQTRQYAVTSEEIKENHFVDLLALPYYNVDILTNDLDTEQECAICFGPFCQQDIVTRLECLCIYHKTCFDEWTQRKPCCPLHTDQINVTQLNKLNTPATISETQQKFVPEKIVFNSNDNLHDKKSPV